MGAPAAAAPWSLRADRVLQPDGVGPAVVVLDGGRVVEVGPDGPADLDLGGATLLPGLVDAHVHLAFDASADVVPALMEEDDDALLAQMAARARRVLDAGVTTVRDLGDRRYLSLQLRERLRAVPAEGPELLVAGPPLTRRKGHCWFLGGEADTPAELVAAVAERAQRGCDVVKVMVTGGVLTPGFAPHESQYDAAAVRAVVEAAHGHGLPVAAHAHGPQGIADAVAAGVDTVEHCTWFTPDGVEVDHSVVEQLAQGGTVVSLTLGTLPGAAPPPAVAQRLARMQETLLLLHSRGVPLALGTDAGIGPGKPHDVLPHAVVALAGTGIGMTDALAAATTTAARACRVADRKGRIVAGYDADLLAVRGDPWADASALHDVVAVVRAGELVRGPA